MEVTVPAKLRDREDLHHRHGKECEAAREDRVGSLIGVGIERESGEYEWLYLFVEGGDTSCGEQQVNARDVGGRGVADDVE